MRKIFKWDVFVSHNHRQKPWVRGAVCQRRDLGLRVFFDEDDIEPGEKVLHAIERGLLESRHTVLIITPAAVSSPWVALETAIAVYQDPDARPT